MDFELVHHAREELARRDIPLKLLEEVLDAPQQIVPAHGGRSAYQSLLDFGEGRIYLLRAIVDEEVNPPKVVTVYKTSKIGKYWSDQQ